MALRHRNMVCNVRGNTALSLAAAAGESLLVKAIYVYNPVGAYLTVRVARTTAAYIRVGGTQGNQAFFPTHAAHHLNLLDLLFGAELWSGIPIPEGETMVFSGAHQAAANQTVVYDVYDSSDVLPNAVNGPDADVYEFFNFGRFNTTLAAGDNLYDTVQTPTEFPAFPFGAVSPAGKKVEILGIAVSDIGKSASSQANRQETTWLKLVQERTVLFDEDRLGLLFEGLSSSSADQTNVATGMSMLGGQTDADLSPPLMFPEPLVFQSNEELNLSVFTVVTAGSANILAADAEVCLIERVSPG